MPNAVGGISAASALASISIALEQTPGLQSRLPNTQLNTTLSLLSQPTATTGERLVIYLYNFTLASNLTNGITVTGNTLSATNVSEPITVTPNVQAQNARVGKFEYVTIAAFTSVTSITVNSTLVNGGGQIEIKSVPAAKYLIPSDMECKGPGFDYYSANYKRASMERHFNIEQLSKKVTLGKFDSDLYPNTSLYWPYALINANPTITPLNNAAPVVLKTGATSSPITLTTSPSATPPGLQLQFVVTNASASGTIAITGTDFFGNALSELLTPSGNGTYPTVGYYYTVSSVVVTGLTGYSITVNGLGAGTLKAPFTPTSNPQTITGFGTPVVPGQFLQFAVSGNAAAATLTITGVDNYGHAIPSEVVSIPANATSVVYSQNIYSSVSSIVSTLATTATLTVNGTQGFLRSFVSGRNVYTMAIEEYTGADTIAIPFGYFEEGTLEFEAEKEVKLTAKGMAQDYLPIGDRTAASLFQNTRATPLGQPTDVSMTGPDAIVYVDPITGTPLSTSYTDYMTFKLDVKRPQDAKWTISGKQGFDRIYSKKPEYMLSVKADFRDETQAEKFRQNQKQYVGCTIPGPSIGGGYQDQWQIILPSKYMKYEKSYGVDSSSVDVDADLTGEYDPILGGSFKLNVISQVPPSYTS